MRVVAYPTCDLGGVAELYDSLHQTPTYANDGYPMIRVTDIRRGFLDTTTAMKVTQEVYELFSKKHKPQIGDILFSRVGSYGNSTFVDRSVAFCLGQNTVCISPDRQKIQPAFLYSALNSDDLFHQIRSFVSGASQGTISLKSIRKLQVPIPPPPVQQRIAGILSAYDELIENSQRRIKILESMARGLYREWFVRFRFPGHENHPRVASALGEIPEGWEVKTVADAFVISGGGTPSRKEDSFWKNGTIQWYSPTDLTRAGAMFIDDSSDHITELGLAQSSARMFPARSVMLTSRATIGAISINTQPACTNQGFITCLPNERVSLYFLFHWLTENVPTFQRMASGATFKEISRGVFKTIDFLQPPDALVGRFEAIATPMAAQVLSLQRQIQNLRRTRDLLLPRLLSGQIEVEIV